MAKMNSYDWELEMNRMLDSFDCQASTSLVKISERFAELGRPFDKKFRKYFLKMSNLRLDSCYTKIELKHWNKSRGYVSENQNDSAREHQAHQTVSNPDASAGNNEHTIHKMSNAAAGNDNTSLIVIKNENSNDLIEIIDSDDERDSVQPNEPETMMQAKETVGENGLIVVMQDSNDDGTNADGITIKEEPVALVKVEIMDAQFPLVIFDPNRNNDESDTEKGDSALTPRKRQGSTTKKSRPSTKQIKNNMKRNDGKRLKCEQCGYATNRSDHLKKHQKVHVQEKLLGVTRDSNNLYQCTHCVRQFTKFENISRHMKGSHKNDQYLYDCARCMRQFARTADKDRHESQCEGRHFQCHLCKVFVTGYKSHMHQHMRVHSGVKPFRCMVCDKYYQKEANLKHHLNSVHARSQK